MECVTSGLTLLPALACSLGRNEFGAEGAKSLAEALTVNTTLSSLEYAAARPHSNCQQPLTLLCCPRLQHLAQQTGWRDWLREGN